MTRALWAVILLVVLAGALYGADLTVGSGGAYETIAAALAEASPGDTLTLQAGTHTVSGAALLTGMVVRGSTSDRANHTIVNGATDAPVFTVTDGRVAFLDLTFDTSADHADNVVEGSNADLYFQACAFDDCNAVSLITTTTRAARLSGCMITDNTVDEYCVSVTSGTDLKVTDCILNGNTCGNGVLYAIAPTDSVYVWRDALASNAFGAYSAVYVNAAATTKVTLSEVTFDQNTNTIVAGGQIKAKGNDAATLTLDHVVITGGGSTYAVADDSEWDMVEHVDSHGNGEDHIFGIAGCSYADTIHVDPDYRSEGAEWWDYVPSAAAVVNGTDGLAMGWRDPDTRSRIVWVSAVENGQSGADGSFEHPYDNPCAAESLAPGDTLKIAAGNYDCTCTIKLQARDVTFLGIGDEPEDVRIVCAAPDTNPILLEASAGGVTVDNVKFTASDSLNLATSNRGLIYGTADADTLTLQSVTVESLWRTSGIKAKNGLAIYLEGTYPVIDDLYLHAIYDTCAGSGVNISSCLALANDSTDDDTPFSVTDSRFVDLKCGRYPLYLANADLNCFFTGNLLYDVDATETENGGFPFGGVVHFCGGTEGNGFAPAFRVNHNTFYDCDNSTPSLGIISINDATSTMFASHNVFYGTTKCFDNFLGAATNDVDSLNYSVSYGAPFCKPDDIENAGVDTIRVDPDFATIGYDDGDLRPREPDVCETADGSYMGWIEGVPRSAAHHGTPTVRWRRFHR